MKLPAVLPSTRLAVQVAGSALLAVLFVDTVDLERPYWVVLTAIIVMVGTVGETLTRSVDRIVGTLVGLLAGVGLYWAAVRLGAPPLLLLAIAAPAVIFCKFASYRLMVVGLTIMLVFLFRLGGADDALLVARLVDTAIGAAIATVVSLAVLPIPTRKPVERTVDAYVAALTAMVHDSIEAIAKGAWSGAIEAKANALRGSEGDLERLAESLKAESTLIGGGRLARGALALLPVIRGHVDAVVQAAEPAARSGLGPLIAAELKGIDDLVAANLGRLRDGLVTGAKQPIPRLDVPVRQIEDRLAAKLAESPQSRREVMTVLNAILVLRRLNRGLRHAMELAG